jgi:hypothetical protein
MPEPVDDAGLSSDIRSYCQAIEAYTTKNERGSKRLSTISIVSSAIAAALTAGPAFGGRSFAETVQQGLSLGDSSTVWRSLCFGAVVVSVTAGITTEMVSKGNLAGHLIEAHEARALLLKLERRLRRREVAPGAAMTEFEDIVDALTFIPLAGAGAPSGGHDADRRAVPARRGPAVATVLAATVALVSAVLLLAGLVGYGLGLREEPGPSTDGGTAGAPSTTSAPTTTAGPTSRAPTSTAPDPAELAVFAGGTDQATATLAIVAGAGQAAAYVCDGDQFEAWLSGDVVDGRMQLAGAGGATLTGTLEEGLVSGDLVAGGVATRFVATTAGPPAGVYRAEIEVNGQASVIGWAVVSEDVQVGVANVGGLRTGAPPLDLDDLSFSMNGEHRAERVTP